MIAQALLLLAAQITPMQPLPKGTGLPPPNTEEGQVMAPVNALFAALTARDAAAAQAAMRPDATTTVAAIKPDGTKAIRHMTAAEFAAGLKPGPERFQEVLTDPAIEVDGDIAYVWGRYDFYIDGKRSHCGFDHFDLVRADGSWKIQNHAQRTGLGGGARTRYIHAIALRSRSPSPRQAR